MLRQFHVKIRPLLPCQRGCASRSNWVFSGPLAPNEGLARGGESTARGLLKMVGFILVISFSLCTAKVNASGNPEAAKEIVARTAAQKKLDSHIVLAIKKSRREPPFDKPTKLDPDLTIGVDGRVATDLTATVTESLIEHIKAVGGTVIAHLDKFGSVRALIPLDRLESLALRADIIFIKPAVQAQTNRESGASQNSLNSR